MENHLGQPVGGPIDWVGAIYPSACVIKGQYCQLEPLTPDHAPALFAAYKADKEDRIWTYLPIGPYDNLRDFTAWVMQVCDVRDPQYYAICHPDGTALGYASYLNINASMGTIEVGWINFSPALQGTKAATEAMFLLMQRAFAMQFRRYEWKCDALNAASRKAAKRLGFTFEGVFRQAAHYKGRNRDTAWYSITDGEWPAIESAFNNWLDPTNFDANGQQRQNLKAFMP